MSPRSHPLAPTPRLIRFAQLRRGGRARRYGWFALAGALTLAACGTTEPVAATPAQLRVFATVVPGFVSLGNLGDSIRVRVAAENRAKNAVRIDLGEWDRDPFGPPRYPNEGASFGYQIFRVESGSSVLVTGAREIPQERYFAIEADSYRSTDFYLHLSGESVVVLTPGAYEIRPFFNSNESAQPVRLEVVP